MHRLPHHPSFSVITATLKMGLAAMILLIHAAAINPSLHQILHGDFCADSSESQHEHDSSSFPGDDHVCTVGHFSQGFTLAADTSHVEIPNKQPCYLSIVPIKVSDSPVTESHSARDPPIFINS